MGHRLCYLTELITPPCRLITCNYCCCGWLCDGCNLRQLVDENNQRAKTKALQASMLATQSTLVNMSQQQNMHAQMGHMQMQQGYPQQQYSPQQYPPQQYPPQQYPQQYPQQRPMM